MLYPGTATIMFLYDNVCIALCLYEGALVRCSTARVAVLPVRKGIGSHTAIIDCTKGHCTVLIPPVLFPAFKQSLLL